MWKVIRASVIGTSHAHSGQPCQDDCRADVVGGADGQEFLVCIVSDGAGSAQEGGTGAALACSTARASIAASLSRSKKLAESDVESWIADVRSVISAAAEANELSDRDYACTLLGAVVGNGAAVFFQIGDGSIVVSSGSALGVVFWPDAGPYANMTYFVTEEDALSHLHVSITHTQVDELALFTDGIQRLALSFEQLTPHYPFFEPMLNVLRKRSPDECAALDQQLALFLESTAINERTDDDKTLVLATRRMS